MKKIVIIGNWKMNKNIEETKDFFSKLAKELKANKGNISKDIEFGIGANDTLLSTVAKDSKKINNFYVAAQDMSQEESGAYTAQTSASMLKSVGANSVILGHSEVRRYHGDTNKMVNDKTIKAIEKGLTPIVCIGETLEEKESGKTKSVLKKQIKENFKNIDFDKIIIAYEPIWAIGTGKTATADDAQEMCKYIRSLTSKNVVIQYGGSVNPKNVKELMEQEDINGALVGGASVDPQSFVKLLTLGK